MKNLKWILLLALLPMTVQAANYEYECEADADGVEGLCLAEPTERPTTKKKVSNIATKEEPRKDDVAKDAAANPPVFGAADVGQTGQPAPGVSTKVQKANAATQAIRAQEKIRQVETFLQPIKGSNGFGGEDGPAKAGK